MKKRTRKRRSNGTTRSPVVHRVSRNVMMTNLLHLRLQRLQQIRARTWGSSNSLLLRQVRGHLLRSPLPRTHLGIPQTPLPCQPNQLFPGNPQRSLTLVCLLCQMSLCGDQHTCCRRHRLPCQQSNSHRHARRALWKSTPHPLQPCVREACQLLCLCVGAHSGITPLF